MILNTAWEEEVGGQVVGRYMLTCSLRYQGRKQGKTIYAETAGEAMQIAEAQKAEIRSSLGGTFGDIYPLDAWELLVHD